MLFILSTASAFVAVPPAWTKDGHSRVSTVDAPTPMFYKNIGVDEGYTYNKNKDAKIVICGGGIGGMVLALALVDAGFHDIYVYESTREIQEIGVGINIQPHAVRELIELGLGEELERVAIPTGKIQYYHLNGQVSFPT